MAQSGYSFIDIAVLDAVRDRFAAGDAVIVLAADLEEVIWANGAGAALLGHGDVESVIGAEAGLNLVARRQIAATPGFPQVESARPALVRIGGRTLAVNVAALALPDGERAIMLAVPPAGSAPGDAGEIAARVVSGFGEADRHAAFLDGEGRVLATSPGFEKLAFASETLSALARETSREPDRLVKRVVETGRGGLPTGLARLGDDPARILLVAVRETAPEASPSAPEPKRIISERKAPEETPHVDDAPAGEQPRDDWYFSDSPPGDRDDLPRAPRGQHPVRFIWRTDAEGSLSAISPEFCAAVGLTEAELVGRTFADLAARFGFDREGEIAGLLSRRDTWSGRSVLWPVAGTISGVTVDLAALPTYSRERVFEGFRGFGVARMEAPIDLPRAEPPDPAGIEAVNRPLPPADPFNGEAPAIALEETPARRSSDKVVRLAEHRSTVERGLSPVERSAFREIGDRLREETGEAPTEAPLMAEAALPEAVGGPGAAPATEPAPERPEIPAAPETVAAPEAAVPETPEPEVPQMAEPPAERTGTPTEPEAEAAIAATPEPEAPAAEAPAVEQPYPLFPEPGSFVPSAFAAGMPAQADAAPRPVPDTAILDRLPLPLLIHSGDLLHHANREFLALTGYADLAALADAGGLEALFAGPGPEVDEDGHRCLRLVRQDGDEIAVEAHIRSVPWRGGKALMLALRSASPVEEEGPSERLEFAAVRAESAMEELIARTSEMQTIVDTATDGLVLIESDGTIRSISRPAEALFGFDTESVAGKPFESLFAVESQRTARDYLSGLSENGVASVLNDGREVIGREAQGRFIPLFMTIGRLPREAGFCAVLRDITQWKRAEEQLTQARAQAERASSQKTDFLARISHEIRTPLNAIIGFSELMLDEKFGPIGSERYRDYLRDINRSGNHVLDLVNDLLDISKIEAGEQEMSYEAVSLNDTLAEAVAIMQPQANRERVIIRSSFAAGLPDVVADLRSVRQIALNLLSNAVRFTQAGGQVIVSTAYEPRGEVVIRVRDTGIGMTPGEIEQALKPFKQINTMRRPRGDGTGLGLPLTKALVEANRAGFTISSTPGEGTLVEVAFPSTRVLAH